MLLIELIEFEWAGMEEGTENRRNGTKIYTRANIMLKIVRERERGGGSDFQFD